MALNNNGCCRFSVILLLACLSHHQILAISEKILMNTPYKYEYQFVADLDLSDLRTVKFSVQACTDAHISLQPNNHTINRQAYEIVLGGWDNRKSVIRREFQQQKVRASKRRMGVINCDEQRDFWISWTDGIIQVGIGHNITDDMILMEFGDSMPLPVTAMAVSTGFGSTGSWIIYKPIPGEFHAANNGDGRLAERTGERETVCCHPLKVTTSTTTTTTTTSTTTRSVMMSAMPRTGISQKTFGFTVGGAAASILLIAIVAVTVVICVIRKNRKTLGTASGSERRSSALSSHSNQEYMDPCVTSNRRPSGMASRRRLSGVTSSRQPSPHYGYVIESKGNTLNHGKSGLGSNPAERKESCQYECIDYGSISPSACNPTDSVNYDNAYQSAPPSYYECTAPVEHNPHSYTKLKSSSGEPTQPEQLKLSTSHPAVEETPYLNEPGGSAMNDECYEVPLSAYSVEEEEEDKEEIYEIPAEYIQDSE